MEAVNPTTQSLELAVKTIIRHFDKDSARDGLKETPRRYIKFLEEFTAPSEFELTEFDGEGYDEMIIQKNIPFFSLCEHHLAPFFGTATIAYIPSKKIVGLSKLARTVEKFACGFQNQERITKQIAEYLMKQLSPLGVGVTLKAQHLCMAMRGVKKPNVDTITSAMLGAFRENPATRSEFLQLAGND
jgi:GTP cyclohydrolase I